MKTLTQKELVDFGAVYVPFTTFGVEGDYFMLDGVKFTHEANDYQSGCGNHDDYKLFRAES